MTTQQFVEDAIKGGWKLPKPAHVQDGGKYDTTPTDFEVQQHTRTTMFWHERRPGGGGMYTAYPTAEILLDPLAWQAVGKARAWSGNEIYWTKQIVKGDTVTLMDEWECNMHTFIDALCEGKTIEEALAELT